MKKFLIPDVYLQTVHDLDIDILKKREIKGVIIDIDNTLVSWETKNADEKVTALINSIRGNDFKMCILSNNTKKRVDEFNKDFNLPAIYDALKPRKASFIKAMKLMDTDPESTAVIGDQIFTDMLGGNRLGLFTILVAPISPKEFWWTRIVRRIEKRVLRKMKSANQFTK